MNKLIKPKFIAGYKCDKDQEDTFWLCNHPSSTELIFSKDETKGFAFDREKEALLAMTKLLITDNRFWFIPVVKAVSNENQPGVAEERMSLEQTEAKIKALLQLFNERSNSQLELFLTLNKENNTLRGYGSGAKLGEEVPHFVALLAVKGMKVKQEGKSIFTVYVEPSG
jgi:hypothetical protein